MRVLHVLHSIEHSGAEVMLAQAAPLFSSRGIELHALATGEPLGRYAQSLHDAGFALYHLPFEPSLRFLLSFWRLLRRGRFDVVHVHTEQAFFWYGLVAHIAGVHCVVRSVHAIFDFRGPLWLERWIQRHLARSLFAERAVAPSPSVQNAEERNYGIRPLLIPNWTDPVCFAPEDSVEHRSNARRALGVAEDAVVFVSVGSCQQVKNHDAIVRALAQIAVSCPRAQYLHVGGGDLEDQEKRLASSLGVANRVTFIGQRDDIPEVLQASDVFVMPSSREGFAISCLEAMSCGLPVIAADAPGLRDLVTDGETGLLVADMAELARAMARVYNDGYWRAIQGEAGRKRVLADFSLELSVESYLRLYQDGHRAKTHPGSA